MSDADFEKVAQQTEAEMTGVEIPIIVQQQEQPPQEKKSAQSPPAAISIGADGRLVAKNNAELMRYCNALSLGGVVPDRFKEPQKLFAALMFVRDMKLPDTAIRQVAVIHGTPSLFGDLPLALVQMTGELSYFREVWFDEKFDEISFENKNLNAEVYGAVCFIARSKMNYYNRHPGESEKPQSFSFTIKDATQAGMWPPKKGLPWDKYTKLMLRYKARSIALKSVFADAISGAAIAEYDYDVNDPEIDVTPKKTTLAEKLAQETVQ